MTSSLRTLRGLWIMGMGMGKFVFIMRIRCLLCMRRLRPIDVPLSLTGPVALAKDDFGLSELI